MPSTTDSSSARRPSFLTLVFTTGSAAAVQPFGRWTITATAPCRTGIDSIDSFSALALCASICSLTDLLGASSVPQIGKRLVRTVPPFAPKSFRHAPLPRSALSWFQYTVGLPLVFVVSPLVFFSSVPSHAYFVVLTLKPVPVFSFPLLEFTPVQMKSIGAWNVEPRPSMFDPEH